MSRRVVIVGTGKLGPTGTVDTSALTVDGDILTRAGGVVTKVTRANLAADAAFVARLVPRTAAASGGAYDIVSGVTTLGGSNDMVVALGGSTADPHVIGSGVSLPTIGGGYDNTITTGIAQTIAGGAHHVMDASSGHGFVGGGSYQEVHGAYGVVAGGFTNKSEGDYSAVAGGRNNVAGDPTDRTGKRDQFVGAGTSNEAKGNQTVVGGGNNNQADGPIGVISGGDGNTINSAASWGSIGGGSANLISASYGAIAGGIGGRTQRFGEFAHAAGVFTTNGDAQASIMVARATTTNATQTELFLDGVTATQRMVVPSDTTWMFDITVVARRTDVDDESAAYHYRGCIDRNAGVATTALVGTVTETVVAEDTAAWSVLVDANTAQGALRIRVTGEAAKTIRWVARVDVVMVTG